MSGTFSGRIAYAQIKYDAGDLAPSFVMQSGDFQSVAWVDDGGGVGHYAVTLKNQIDPAECCYLVTCRFPVGRGLLSDAWGTIENPTDTSFDVRCIDENGTAGEIPFDVVIFVNPSV